MGGFRMLEVQGSLNTPTYPPTYVESLPMVVEHHRCVLGVHWNTTRTSQHKGMLMYVLSSTDHMQHIWFCLQQMVRCG